MSYILDALKKSEKERELVRMLRTTGAAPGFSIAGRHRAWPLLAGVVVLLALGLMALHYWRPVAPAAPSALPASAEPVPPVPAPAPQVALVEPKPTPAADVIPLADPKPAPNAARTAVQDLGVQTIVRPPPVEPPTPTVVAAAKPVAPASPPVSAPLDSGPVLFLRQLPEDFQRQLPELVVNIHLYSANESENLVYINDRQYRRGEEVARGVRLEQIVPEGVVLSYEGTRFKVPRPN